MLVQRVGLCVGPASRSVCWSSESVCVLVQRIGLCVHLTESAYVVKHATFQDEGGGAFCFSETSVCTHQTRHVSQPKKLRFVEKPVLSVFAVRRTETRKCQALVRFLHFECKNDGYTYPILCYALFRHTTLQISRRLQHRMECHIMRSHTSSLCMGTCLAKILS